MDVLSKQDPVVHARDWMAITAEQVRVDTHEAHEVAEALAAEVERLRAGLQRIKDECGQVCSQFETCEHVACAGSSGAWFIADETLAPTAPAGA